MAPLGLSFRVVARDPGFGRREPRSWPYRISPKTKMSPKGRRRNPENGGSAKTGGMKVLAFSCWTR